MTTPPDTPTLRLVTDPSPAALAEFDAVIDTRSPAEFAEDHIPGAINLPVLSNEERAEVGTLYVQQSRFLARRIGAAIVARNIAAHLEGALADRPGGFRPLVYCWRGGQRSHAMATVLSQVGWRTALLEGGYRTWRRRVQRRLYDDGPQLKVVLLDGHTGAAKTEILHRLAGRGVQTLDLEGLAGHRGSLFGGFGGRPQPSQKMFESRLLSAMEALDPDKVTVIEAESSKVGERMVPPVLWRAMQAAPRVRLEAPPEQRARYLAQAYRDVIDDRATLEEALARLPIRASPERRKAWAALLDAGDWEALALALLQHHYDPAYTRSAGRDARPILGVVPISPSDDDSQAGAADEIARIAAGA